MTPFKEGDWIIASRALVITQPSFSLFSAPALQTTKDSAYMRRPVKVMAVTEAHLIIENFNYKWEPEQTVISLEEVAERGFIIANQALVDFQEAKRQKEKFNV
jgi:phenylpyruvate tautomerase PptA (4-oxalocrotonate tautomerase family)